MARKPDPKGKAGFVRSLPAGLSAAEVVAKAKAAGVKVDVNYVYKVRGATKAKRKAVPVAKRGRGRPRKVASSGAVGAASGGLIAEIERIVERKVTELLRGKLGALFGG